MREPYLPVSSWNVGSGYQAQRAAWPSGLGRGLQSPAQRFDSARRLHGGFSSLKHRTERADYSSDDCARKSSCACFWTPGTAHENRLLLPKGRSLPEHVWLRRHHGLLLLLWLPIAGLTALELLRGYGPRHAILEVVALLVILGIIGTSPRASRRLRSMMVAMALLTSSALLVHLTGALIESHFHSFVTRCLLASGTGRSSFSRIGYVVVHDGVFAQWIRPLSSSPQAWKQSPIRQTALPKCKSMSLLGTSWHKREGKGEAMEDPWHRGRRRGGEPLATTDGGGA
jgi:hypothetical protein